MEKMKTKTLVCLLIVWILLLCVKIVIFFVMHGPCLRLGIAKIPTFSKTVIPVIPKIPILNTGKYRYLNKKININRSNRRNFGLKNW
jgi:hypothetical protein